MLLATLSLTMVNKRQHVSKSNTRHRFPPVGVTLPGEVLCQFVNSVEDAARLLLTDWPVDDGEDFLTAIKACLDGLHDKALVSDVRAAFVSAAREADLTVFG